jgi:hypothetical protein
MPLLKFGHAPGHIRETACEAFQAWIDWDGELPEPTVTLEINYVPHTISISQACRLVWNCTDVMPDRLFYELQDAIQSALHSAEPVIKRQTYAACARAILEDIKSRSQRAA